MGETRKYDRRRAEKVATIPASSSTAPPAERRTTEPGTPPSDTSGTSPVPPEGHGRLGRYRLAEEIASGGMATVYSALLEGVSGFERVVAIKEIHPHLAKNPAFVEMFLDEARISSLIHHPNVCQVLDFGREGSRHYLALEYLVGEPVSAIRRRLAKERGARDPRVDLPILARIVADACEGLHAAHELSDADGVSLGVVHRDVSPANLFVTYDGLTKVMDFGIAHARDKIHQTNTGEVKGHFAYIAPEQLAGLMATRVADVWSIGVVLWELLTGQRLFRRNTTLETMRAVTGSEIPSLVSLRPDLPQEVSTLVGECLTRNALARPETTRDVGQRLLSLVGGHASAADVARWMDGLFPEGRQSRQVVVDKTLFLSGRKTRRIDSRLWVVAGLAASFGLLVGLGPRLYEWAVRPATSSAPLPSDPGRRALDPEEESSPVAVEAISSTPPPSPAASTEVDVPPDEPETPSEGAEGASRTANTVTPRRRPPAEPRLRGTGRFNLVTPGVSAAVYLRGRLLGWTPLSVAVAAGRHRIELRPRGDLPPRSIRVTVRPEERTLRTVQLTGR